MVSIVNVDWIADNAEKFSLSLSHRSNRGSVSVFSSTEKDVVARVTTSCSFLSFSLSINRSLDHLSCASADYIFDIDAALSLSLSLSVYLSPISFIAHYQSKVSCTTARTSSLPSAVLA